jgi:hypothetical protein
MEGRHHHSSSNHESRHHSHTGEGHMHHRPLMLPREKSMRRQLFIDDRSGQQFRYFRDEFVAAALGAGITLPLDMIEDETGRIFNFLKQGGPEFVFNILLVENNGTNFLRVCLTLLITTFVILKSSLPAPAHHKHQQQQDQARRNSGDGSVNLPGGQSGGAHMHRYKSRLDQTSMTAEEALQDWIYQCIQRVIDEGAVSVLISIIVHSSHQEIQGLAICLLSHVVSVSRDAAVQILQPPNCQEEYIHGEDFFSPRHHKHTKPVPAPDNARNQHVSVYNRLAPAKKPNALPSHKPQHHTAHIDNEGKSKPSNEDRPPSCLSYILTVCATFRNRIVIVGNCADIIISVANAYSDDYFAYQIAKTPSCHLPHNGTDHNQHGVRLGLSSFNCPNSNAGSHSAAAAASNTHQKKAAFNGLPSVPNLEMALAQFHYHKHQHKHQPIPWLGVKLLLKFLHRVQTFGLDDGDGGGGGTEKGGGTGPTNNVSARDPNNILGEKENQSMPKVVRQVLLALCTLIAKSPRVTDEIIRLPGAVELIRLQVDALRSSRIKIDRDESSNLSAVVNQCLTAIAASRKKANADDVEHAHNGRQNGGHTGGTFGSGHDLKATSKEGCDQVNGRVDEAARHQHIHFEIATDKGTLPRIGHSDSSHHVAKSQTDAAFESMGLHLIEESLKSARASNVDMKANSYTDADDDSISSVGTEGRSVEWLLKHNLSMPKLPEIITGTLQMRQPRKLKKEIKQLKSYLETVAEKSKATSQKKKKMVAL